MAWVEIPIWKGTHTDAMDLNAAVIHNCDCQATKRRCGAHRAMLEQRWLDGILFMRFMRERLEYEEGLRNADWDSG